MHDITFKSSRWQEIIKLEAEINYLETKKQQQQQKVNKKNQSSKEWFLWDKSVRSANTYPN